MASTQTRRKRRVGAHMQKLRERAQLTTEDVAALLRRTQPQVSKFENGYNLIAFAELVALLAHYNATDEEREKAFNYYDDAKQDSRRIEGSSGVKPKFRTFLRNEADAGVELEVATGAIPGLCQTEGYARASINAAPEFVESVGATDSNVKARLARQKLLDADPALTYHALIDEGVCRRQVGGPKIMAAQLRRLADLAERPNVTLQVVPFGAGAYGTMSGPITVLRYAGPEDPDTVYAEHAVGGEWVDAEDEIDKFLRMFERISRTQALSVAESIAFYNGLAQELEAQ
jgi:transcriptional regulator with XRE-family HTH domain